MNRAVKTLYRVFILFLILPIVSLILWCFVTKLSVGEPIATYFTLDGWQYFFRSKDIYNAIYSSVQSMAISALAVAISVLCARAMIIINRYLKIIEMLFYLPLLFPPIAVIMGFHGWALKAFQYPKLALIIAYLFFSFPYAFQIVYSAYRMGVKEAMDTAQNLGANGRQVLVNIELPMLTKHLISAFIIAYGVCYGQYLVAIFFESKNSFIIQMTHFLGSNNRNISSIYTLIYIVFAFIVFIPQIIYSIKKSGGDSDIPTS